MSTHYTTVDWIIGGFISALGVLAPAKATLLATLAVTVIDTITGIYAARRRSEAITSAELGRAISKGFRYTLAIITAFIGEKYLLDGSFPVSRLVAGGIFAVEGLSIFENLQIPLGALDRLRGVVEQENKNDTKDSK